MDKQSTTISAKQRTSPPPLQLFRVTLLWNANDTSEGDYCDMVWARTEEEAITRLAKEMASHPNSGVKTGTEWKAFVKNTIAAASDYAAERVVDSLSNHIRLLLAGPKGDFKGGAYADFSAISSLLGKYMPEPTSSKQAASRA